MIDRQTTKEKAYEALRQLLVAGKFEQGEKLHEEELARQFNISRTPVHNALARLVQEGLLVSMPFKGVFVRNYSQEEVRELCELRAALEAFAVRVACRRATDEELKEIEQQLERTEKVVKQFNNVTEIILANTDFHMAIVLAAHNSWLSQTLESLHGHFGLLRATNLRNIERRNNIIQEHRQIVQAILARDETKAENAMLEHMSSAAEVFLE